MYSNKHVQHHGYLVRNGDTVWRDIAGEVVISEKDNGKIHSLNKTASIIWSLADGTRKTDDIITELCSRFEVTVEQARADVEEFCNQLLNAKLISLKDTIEQK